MSQCNTKIDLIINVGSIFHGPVILLFYLKFFMVEYHIGITSQYDAMTDVMRIVGHSDLFFMVILPYYTPLKTSDFICKKYFSFIGQS